VCTLVAGSLITWDSDCSKEIKRRIARATGAMTGFKKVWNSTVVDLDGEAGGEMMASTERELIMGAWDQSEAPSGVQGQSPG